MNKTPQQRWEAKQKMLTVKYPIDIYEKIEKLYTSKGFSSGYSYLKYLVNEDLKKNDLPIEKRTDKKRLLIEGLIDRLSEEKLEKVIDYIRLLLK